MLALSVLLPLLLSACASFSTDGGFSEIEKIAKDKLGKELQWQRSSGSGNDNANASSQRVQQLLGAALSGDDAVQIALLNNRGLQASFAELGIAEADFVQSGRLLNPSLSFGRLQRGDEKEIELGLHLNLMRLFTMPYARQMEQRRFEQTRQQLALQMLATASETRKAYYLAVAADQTVLYMQQVKKAADASAELARRMERAGNFNKLQRAREQSFYADAVVTLARAEQAQSRAREKLLRLLGLSGAQIAFTLPARLPDLPKSAEAPADARTNVEQLAMTQRLDVQAARLGTEQLAQNLGLSKATRLINVLEFGVVRNTSNQMPTQRGYEVSLELPLFDWGDAKVAKAEALYMQALHRTAETAVNAQSEVRLAYALYRSSFDIAVHYRDEILPLKKKISDENLLRYNGMFIGVFDLLADARAQIFSVNSAIEATRDFWLAQADLEMSLIGKPAMNAPASESIAAEN